MSNQLTIFRKKGNKEAYTKAYEEVLALWQVPYEEMMIPTRFGETHIIAAGPQEAEPMILIHGVTLSATMWYPNIESFSQGYRVYALDTIGDMGKGDVTKILNTIQDVADWLDDVYLALNLSSAVLIGHSLGGWFVMNYALHAPKKVRKIVLLAPVAGICHVTPKFFLKICPAALFPSESRIRKALSWFFSPSYQVNLQSEKLIRQFVISDLNCFPCLRIFPTVFKEDELRKLSTETLLLVGEKEVIYSPVKLCHKAKRLLPNLTFQIIPNACHLLSIEQYEIVNKAIMSFLKEKIE